MYRCFDFQAPFIVLGFMILLLGLPAVKVIEWDRLVSP